jgi:hypothetical protein
MRFHFYHSETGILYGNTYATSIADPERALESARGNAPPDHLPIEGAFSWQSQRIDPVTKDVLDYQSPAPTADHEWDTTAKRWSLSADAQAAINRGAAARIRIAHLEANVQPRAIRELQLTRPGAFKRLQDIDDEIVELRKQLGKG